MKATQDNAVWISNTYKQGTSEDNWAAASARYRVPRRSLITSSATTTSATVLSTTDGISNGDSLFLYNSTDGYVDYTVSSATNQVVGSSINSPIVSVVTNHTYWQTTTEKLKLWNADGSKLFTYYNGTFKEYTPPRNWDVKGSSDEGPTYVTAHSMNYNGHGTPNTNYSTCVFAKGGEYLFIMSAMNKDVLRFTLSTPYDLSSAGAATKYVVGDNTSNIWYTTLTSWRGETASNITNGGFCALGFSEDGKKGILMRRDNAQGNYTMGNNLFWSFELSTPYDLDSLTAAKYDKLGFSDSTSYNTLHGLISTDGKVIYGLETYSTSTGYIKRIVLATAWDVDGGYSQQGQASFGSSNYDGQYSDAHCITVPPNGQYFSYESDRYFLCNSNAEANPAWNRTTFNTTSASLTTAPTLIGTQGQNISDVKYAVMTRAEAAKENVAIAFSESSTGTSLVAYTDLDNQGSTALNSTDLVIDGASFTTSSPTFTDNALSCVGSNTSKPNGGTKETELRTHMSFVGAYQLLNPSTYPNAGNPSWDSPQGMAFDHTGTRFWLSGFADNFGGDANIDKAIVEFVLTTPWDLGTASLVKGWDADGPFRGDPSNINVNYQAQAFQFNYDGSKFYIMHSYSSGGQSYLYEGTLSTPYDLSTYSYSHHVDLSSIIGDGSPYCYDFTIAPDGQGIEINKSQTTGDISTAGNCDSVLLKMTTPWTLSSIGYKRAFSGSYGYRTSMFGSADRGYISYSVGFNSGSSYNTLFIGTASGNLTSDVQNHFDGVYFPSFVTDYTNNVAGSGNGGKTLVADNGTKLYIHVPETNTVLMFTGPFGFFADSYTIDITSLGLSERPSDVRFATADTYTSAGSTSLNTTTNLYKEYVTPEVSINAEALRFKIEGDTDAEVTQFNVDLFT